jgi:hypothetical protein
MIEISNLNNAFTSTDSYLTELQDTDSTQIMGGTGSGGGDNDGKSGGDDDSKRGNGYGGGYYGGCYRGHRGHRRGYCC